MNIVIPMAGHGSRFSKAGYVLPKFMIEVDNRTLFEHSLSSLPLKLASKLIFICLSKHNEKYNLDEFIHEKMAQFDLESDIKILYLDNVTKGQADTVFTAQDEVDLDKDLLIYNIDTAFHSNNLASLLQDDSKKKDGVFGVFHSPSCDDKWSFACIDEQGIITHTAEKSKISDYASTGFYHFTKAQDFFQFKHQQEAFDAQKEMYIAPLYNELISVGKKFVIDIVDQFTPLGTPQDVEHAIMNIEYKAT